MPQVPDLSRLVEMLHETDSLVESLEAIPDEQGAEFVESQLDNLSRVNIRVIAAELPRYIERYEEFRDDPRIKFAGLISTYADNYIQDLFEVAPKILDMIEERFYRNGVYVGNQITSRDEHERWYNEFKSLVVDAMNYGINAYKEVRMNLRSLRGLVKNTLEKEHGVDMDRLPTADVLIRAGNKAVSVYKKFEEREMAKYG